MTHTPPVPPARARRRDFFRGYYGRVIATTSFAATFASVVFFNPVLGVFSSSLEHEFGWTRADVALAITFGSAGAAIASPAIGWAIDRRGGGRVMALSALLMGGCLLALARMDALWQLLVFYAIGRALAVGALSPAAFIAVSNWYVRRRAFVTGVVAVAPRLGMATLPALAAVVIGVTGSWRASWVALAIVILAIGVVPPLLFMRRRPEDYGLLPDGDDAAIVAATAAARGPTAPELALASDLTLREAVRTRAYWLIGFAMALVFFSGGSINFHQIPYLIDQGVPRTEAALVVTVFSLVGAVGGLAAGMVAARRGVRVTIAVALFGMSGGVLLLVNAASVPAAMLYAVLYGGFFGAMTALSEVIYADYFGRASVGLIRGSIQPAQLGMNAVGPFATGLWFVATGSYTFPFLVFALCFFVAGCAVALAPRPRTAVSARHGY